MKNSYLGQAWLVLAISLVFGALLAGVQVGLAGKIAANKLNETLEQIPNLVAMPEFDPEADASETAENPTGNPEATKVFDAEEHHIGWVVERELEGRQAYEAFDLKGARVGWVIKAAGNGFADRIELLMGFNADATQITGMFVLDQKETPALGDNITKAKFRDRFIGKPTDVVLSASQTPTQPDQIQALTGATISSQSVCDIVNGAAEQFTAALKEGE
jgi:Na+-translocating ferredoxin:NAD+ oxidoreductase subunit G